MHKQKPHYMSPHHPSKLQTLFLRPSLSLVFFFLLFFTLWYIPYHAVFSKSTTHPNLSSLSPSAHNNNTVQPPPQPPVPHSPPRQVSQTLSPADHPRPPSSIIQNRCILYPVNPNSSLQWEFNSRSLCTFSRVCFHVSPDETVLELPPVQCGLAMTPDMHILDKGRMDEWEGGCDAFLNQSMCAFGHGMAAATPVCPALVDGRQGDPGVGDGEVVIVVPRFPYLANIFHYLNVVTDVAHVIDELQHLVGGTFDAGVRVVFNGWEISTPWQSEITRILLRNRDDVNSIEYLGSTGGCWEGRVVALGSKGHVNMWPFLNSTNIEQQGASVPKGAIRFRKAIYNEFGITGRLPEGDGGWTELPPLVVGYSRRLGINASAEPEENEGRTTRRFREDDERWFGDMLKEECERAGVHLKVFLTTGNETFREQVETAVDVGFMVGIHGANLVNSVFMRPFGSLMEVSPSGTWSRCYMAGANSGLAYWRHETAVQASMEESGCMPDDAACRRWPRKRLVKIDTEKDRTEIRKIVTWGIGRLLRLHDEFPDGIPVVYNETTVYYDIKTTR